MTGYSNVVVSNFRAHVCHMCGRHLCNENTGDLCVWCNGLDKAWRMNKARRRKGGA